MTEIQQRIEFKCLPVGRPKKGTQLNLTPEQQRLRDYEYDRHYQQTHKERCREKSRNTMRKYVFTYKYIREHHLEIFDMINQEFKKQLEQTKE
jgi:hypothetical protein